MLAVVSAEGIDKVLRLIGELDMQPSVPGEVS